MESLRSNALEPTRSELANLAGGARLVRLLPVYGLPLLTLALILFNLNLDFLPGPLQVLAWVLMWAALILTVITGIDYLRHAWKIRRDALAKRDESVA